MTTYLGHDAVDDNLYIANQITIDKVVYDLVIHSSDSDFAGRFIDADVSSFQVRGTSFAYTPSGATGVVMDQRTVLSFPVTTFTGANISLFSYGYGQAGYYAISADIYDIKLYNAGTLIAHYDMSTGTVKDQSGNGNDATNVGGTWQNDTPTTTTIDSGPVPMSASGALSAQPTRVLQSNVNMSATSDLSAQAVRIISASASMQGISTMTAQVGNVAIVDSGPINMSAAGSMAAKATRLVNQKASMAGASDMTAKTNRIRSSRASMQAESALSAHGTRIIAVSADLAAQSTMEVVIGAELIGTIELEGQRELYVYLVGQRELYVDLEGGIGVAKEKNITMFSGDSKIFTDTITDENNKVLPITGASFVFEMNDISTSGTVTDGQNGKVTIKLSPNDMPSSGVFPYEIKMTDVDGNVSTVTYGNITIKK